MTTASHEHSNGNSLLKEYFHDRIVLLLLTVNVFIAILCVATVLLRLGDFGSNYIQSYRSNLGLNAYSVGGTGQMISFALYAVLIVAGQFFVSLRFYAIRRAVAWIVMLLATLLLVLCLIISNSLLGLR